MSFPGTGPKHTFWRGPWRYCPRCDRKTKIADMRWQRGLLLCPFCFDDPPLLGEREVRIAEILEDGKEELTPVEKLRDPTTMDSTDDFII